MSITDKYIETESELVVTLGHGVGEGDSCVVIAKRYEAFFFFEIYTLNG